jgi:hypothetical protein
MADLRRYRWHTGATPRPVGADEALPVLFRDVGPGATLRFLRRSLTRLAGPLTPLTYMRTAAWDEPYVDHGRIGRLVFLRPRTLGVWHSGVPEVFVAEATAWGERDAIGYVPGHVPLAAAAARLAGARCVGELREALGGGEYDDAVRDAAERLDGLEAELAATEARAAPLRAALRSRPEAVREALARLGLDESDLCTAWHHLPAERRRFIAEALGC